MSKTVKVQAKVDTPKQRPEKPNFSEGYCFAREFMDDISKMFGLGLTLQDNEEYTIGGYYASDIGEIVHNFISTHTSEITEYCERIEIVLYSASLFRHFCIECVCREKFSNGYSAMNFLYSLGFITAMAVHMKKKKGQDYLLDAILIIGDIFDFYLESGEFQSAGGTRAFCDEDILLSW